jgi:hypothetical protein
MSIAAGLGPASPLASALALMSSTSRL